MIGNPRKGPLSGGASGWARAVTVLFVLLFLIVPVRAAHAQIPTQAAEYELKAAFLFNFARFTEWPARNRGEAAQPLVIGVLGDDPFGPVLDDTIRGKTVDGRPLVAKRLRRTEDAAGCDLVFIAASEKPRVSRALDAVSAPGVLTVGETDGFAERGGVIGLVVDSDRIRLVVNTDAAARARLRISAKLLAMARVVRDRKGGTR